MRFIRTAKVGTDPFCQLASGKPTIEFDYILLDLLVVLAYPGAHGLTLMPGGIIPDQEPVRLAFFEQALATPLQELGGDGAHRASGHEAQPGLRTVRLIRSPLLPEDAITGQRFGIGIVLAPGLLHQPDGLVLTRPRMHLRQRKAAPPDFIAKANRPRGLLAGPSNQAVSCVFFLLVQRIGAGDPVFGPLPVG